MNSFSVLRKARAITSFPKFSLNLSKARLHQMLTSKTGIGVASLNILTLSDCGRLLGSIRSIGSRQIFMIFNCIYNTVVIIFFGPY